MCRSGRGTAGSYSGGSVVANNPAKAVKKAVRATVESAAARAFELMADRETPPVPGTPGSGTPAVAEPTKPRDPLPPKPDFKANLVP